MESVDPQLNTYFAVQLLPTETSREAAAAICHAGRDAGTLFRWLEVLDTMTFAARTFLRCRSDIINVYPMLDQLLARRRGYVAARPDGQYSVRLTDGRTGTVPGVAMHSVPRCDGYRGTYRGPKIKNWERQFDSV
jgi:hypothetical protein